LHIYDAGAEALVRRLVKPMRNYRYNHILKYQETTGTLWIKYAFYGATMLAASTEGIKALAWPSGEMAIHEERTEEHGGLYWIEFLDEEGKNTRLFLPNFFNTFREMLKQDAAYSDLIGNRGTVLNMLGRQEEAYQHLMEAAEFQP